MAMFVVSGLKANPGIRSMQDTSSRTVLAHLRFDVEPLKGRARDAPLLYFGICAAAP
jgi:hypothetical protein